jgi:hypothetical protein
MLLLGTAPMIVHRPNPGLPGVARASRIRCSVSTGTRGRPKAFPLLVPLVLALATPARTHSTIMLRSNLANTPII